MSEKKEKIDKQHRYPWPVIETAVQLHVVQGLTYRSVSEKMENLGVIVSHKTVFEWVQKFANSVNTKNRRRATSYSIEECEVKCNGEEMFMYRAYDSKKSTLGVILRHSKGLAAAKSFFKKNLEGSTKEG